ncbi:MAG: hypothetical protein M1830_006408 [Pleopsidium flavum]|nr:MAG: hypothetical protein M1830_006408 [Pleopsidium flavum]
MSNNANNVDSASRYKLTVRQQPLAARACGFGERDRRVIDPPPIVQLTLADFDVNSPMDISELRYPFNVVHCTLLSSSSPSTDVTAITDPSSHRTTRRLMGTLVASPFVGGDPDAQPSSSSTDPNSNKPSQPLSCFFIFPDLSCRTPGPYRLHFTLMRLGSEITLLGGRTQIVSSATSEVFQVFSAKDFPGMRASTGLTRGLKKLGAGVSVKKGNGGNGKGSKDGNYQENEGSSEENDDRDEESGDEAKGRERARGRAKKRRKG